MKNRIFLLGVGLMVLATVAFLMPQATVAKVNGSSHDFAVEGLCRGCHVPHHANTALDAPLWGTYLATQSFTDINTSGDGTAATGSAECLGCHDGTWSGMPADANFASDLSGEHPVSTTIVTGTDWVASPGASLKLFGGSNDQVECSTCHDPHNGANVTYFLRMAGNAICEDCHDK